jgi:hypothetical protein
VAVVGAVCVEGAIQLAGLEAMASTATPYTSFAQRIRQFVPPGAHVLGLHTYWFDFQDVEYRSFLVPLLLADEGVPLDQALNDAAPDTDVLLFDSRLKMYFGPEGDASPIDKARFTSWLQGHQASLAGSVEDPTYGVMEIYRLQPRAGTP